MAQRYLKPPRPPDASRNRLAFSKFIDSTPHFNSFQPKPSVHSFTSATQRRIGRRPFESQSSSYPLVCRKCRRRAKGITLYTRIMGSGKSTIEMPALICRSCHEMEMVKPSPASLNPYYQRPLGSRICFLSFEKVQGMDKKDVARLSSTRRYEINHFHNPQWQKTLWRIWFLGRPAKAAR